VNYIGERFKKMIFSWNHCFYLGERRFNLNSKYICFFRQSDYISILSLPLKMEGLPGNLFSVARLIQLKCAMSFNLSKNYDIYSVLSYLELRLPIRFAERILFHRECPLRRPFVLFSFFSLFFTQSFSLSISR